MADKTHLARQEEAVNEQGVQTRATDPGSPAADQTWVETTNKQFKHGTAKTVIDGLKSEFDAGSSGAAKTIDFVNGVSQKLLLTDNVTLTLDNPVNGKMYILKLVQDGTGGRTVTWPASVKWGDGVTPVITTTISHADLISLYYDGTNFFASIAQDYDLT